MAITLETLLIEFKGDFTQFDRQLSAAERRADNLGKKLESKSYKINLDTSDVDRFYKKLEGIDKLLGNIQRKGNFNINVNARQDQGDSGTKLAFKELTSAIKDQTTQVVAAVDKLEKTTAKQETRSFGTLFRENIGKNLAKSSQAAITSPFAFLKSSNIAGQMSNFIGNTVQKALDNLSIQIGTQMELEEGATRMSTALQKGITSALEQGASMLRAEFGALTGQTVAESPIKGTGKGKRDKLISEAAASERSIELLKNELKVLKKEASQAAQELDAFSQSKGFQTINKQIQALKDANTELATSADPLDQSQIRRNESRIQALQQSPVFKQYEDLDRNLKSIINEAEQITKQTEAFAKKAQEATRNLQELSRSQLENAKKQLQQRLANLQRSVGKDDKAFQQQLQKFVNLETKSSKVIAKEAQEIAEFQKKREKLRLMEVDTQAIEATPQNKAQLDRKLANIEKLKVAIDEEIELKKKQLILTRKDLRTIGQAKEELIASVAQPEKAQARELLNQTKVEFNKVQSEIKRRQAKIPPLMEGLGNMLKFNLSDLDKLPTFNVLPEDFKMGGVSPEGLYSNFTNKILLNAKAFKELGKDLNEASLKAIELVAHEFSHGIQTDFKESKLDAIRAGVARPRLLNNLAKMTKEESIEVGKRVKSYQDLNLSANQQLMEIDAFLTGIRAKSKALSVKKVGQTSQIVKAANQASDDVKSSFLSSFQALKEAGLSKEGINQILTNIDILKQSTKNLQQFESLQFSQGAVNPEQFIKDFEEELKKVARIRSAIAKQIKSASTGQKTDLNLPKFETPTNKVVKLSSAINLLGKVSDKTTDVVKNLGRNMNQVNKTGTESPRGNLRNIKAQMSIDPDIKANLKDEADNFKKGFTNKIKADNTVEKSTQELGTDAVKGFKKGIDSKSPSKKTLQEAFNFVQGFINGIKQKISKVSQSTKLMAMEAMDSLREAFRTMKPEELNLVAEGNIAKLDGILADFDNRLNKFEALDDRIAAGIDSMDIAGRPRGQGKRSIKNLITDEDIQGAGMGAGKGLRSGVEGFEQIIKDVLNYDTRLGQFFTSFRKGFQGTGKAAIKAKSQFAAFASAAGLLLFGYQLQQLIQNLVQFQKELDITRAKLTAIGQAPTTNIFEEFGQDADRAGIRVTQFADKFAGMAAALKGKVNDPRGLFTSLATGLADRGVVGEAQGRALTALSQMASKNVVSMEELRQQLAEALPGSLTIAANAMGVTEKQMIAMVSSGKVLASDFLPKFAEELSSVSVNTDTLTKNLAKTQNTIDKIKFKATEVLNFNGAVKALNFTLKALEKVSGPLFIFLGVTAVASLVNLGIVAVKLAASFGILAAAGGFLMTVILPITAAVAALAVTWETLDSVFLTSLNGIKDVNKELKDIANNTLPGLEDSTQQYQASNFLNRLTPGGRLREELAAQEEISKSFDDLLDIDLEFRAKINEDSLEKMSASIEERLSKAQDLSERVANRSVLGLTSAEVEKMMEEIESLNASIQEDIDIAFDPERLRKSLAAIEKLKKAAEAELEKGAAPQRIKPIIAELKVREESIREMLNKVNELTAKTDFTIELDIKAEALQATIQDKLAGVKLQDEIALYQELGKTVASTGAKDIKQREMAVSLRQRELKLINEANLAHQAMLGSLTAVQQERLQNMTGAEDLTQVDMQQLAEARRRIKQEMQAGGQEDPALEAALDRMEDLARNVKRVKEIEVETAQSQFESVTQIRDFQRNLVDLDHELSTAFKQRNRSLSDNSKKVANMQRQFQRENKDFIKQYENLNKSLNKQLREAGNELELLGKEIVNTELINEARQALGASGESMFEGFIDLAEGIFQSELDINERQLTLEEQRIQAEENLLSISEQIEDLGYKREDIERNRLDQLEQLAREQEDYAVNQERNWAKMANRIEDMQSTAEAMGIDFDNIGSAITQASEKLQAAVNALQAPTMGTGTGTGTGVEAFDPLLNLIMKGEGGFGSLNRGVAGDSMGQTLQQYFGRELKDIPLREILEEQAKKNLFAVGAFQFIPETLKEAVKRSGISLDEGFTADVQKQLAIDLMKNKRPEVARFLETGQGLIEAAQGMAREWASIGLSRPEAGRGIGQSRYAGTGGNAASISPQEVQAALQAVRANLTQGQQRQRGGNQFAGFVGNTGIGTGAHLDIRVKSASGQYIDPSKYFDDFLVGGKKLTDWIVTSARGMRVHPVTGQRRMHQGVDFAGAGIEGAPIQFTGQGQVSRVRTPGGTGGGGFVTEIQTATGDVIQLLHLQERSLKAVNESIGKVAQVPQLPTQQLQQQVGQLASLESDRMAAREAREAARIKQDQLRTERDIFQANRQLEQSLENVAGAYNNILSSTDEYITKSKGILNSEEQRKQLLKGLEKEYQDQIKPIEELQQQITSLLEVEDKDQLNKSLEGIKQRFDGMPNLTDKAKESLAEMLELMAAGEIGLEGISGELNELLNQVKDAKALREEFELGQFDAEKRREFDRPMEDVQLEIDREKAMSLLGDNVMIGIEFDERQAELELQRTLEDLEGTLDPSQIEAYGAKLRELNEIKFDKLRMEASDTFKMIEAASGAFEGAMSNLFSGLGDALFNQGEMEEKRGEANVEYAEKVMEIQEKYADNPEQMQKSLESLKELNEIKMDNLEAEVNQTAGVMGLLKNVVLDFTKSIVSSFAQIAAQQVTKSLFGGLMGGLGGGGGLFGIFKYGGEVGGTGQDGLSQAMAKEGAGAIPIVAHKGEQVLTDRNGDAQFFRSLQKSGEWARMKQGSQVANYNMGGTVGNASIQPMSNYYNNNSKSNDIRTISNYNVQVQSANDLDMSMAQIRAAEQRKNQRIYDKNR